MKPTVLILAMAMAGCSTFSDANPKLTCENVSQELIGSTKEQATERVKKSEFSLRIIREDDQRYMGTMDYRLDRINLEIDKGVVREARCG